MLRCNYRLIICRGLVSHVGDKFVENDPHSCNPNSHHEVNMVVAAE